MHWIINGFLLIFNNRLTIGLPIVFITICFYKIGNIARNKLTQIEIEIEIDDVMANGRISCIVQT